MTHLINPMWFYLIGICDDLKLVMMILAVICIVVLGFIAFCYLSEHECDYPKEEKDKVKKIIYKLSIITSIVTLLSILIPTEKTCYKMIIASQVTTENIELVTEQIDKAIDYIEGKKDGRSN